MKVLYELQGIAGLQAAIERASEDVRRRLEIASRDTAIAVVQTAKTLAPVDRGDLRDSISFDGKGLNWRVGLLDRNIPSRGGSNTAHLNPSVYGVWYELGFVTRKIKRQEFVGPAARGEQAAHEQRIINALNSGFARAA